MWNKAQHILKLAWQCYITTNIMHEQLSIRKDTHHNGPCKLYKITYFRHFLFKQQKLKATKLLIGKHLFSILKTLPDK